MGTTAAGIPFLVTELMELGSLTSILQDEATDLPWPLRQRIAFEIASGMALVHSLGRMHRDLKSGNILVTSSHGSMHVKVADFGTAVLVTLATHVPSNDEALDMESRVATMRTKGVGTPLWMAPEVLAGSTYGPAADVYSYAIVMWELAARDEPWRDVTGPFLLASLLNAIRADRRPAIDPKWPSAFVGVMRRCWAGVPMARPSFATIVELLGGELRLA